MEFRFSTYIAAIAFLALLAIPIRLAAQDKQDHNDKNVRYSLQVLPTLGGAFGEGWGVNRKGWAAGRSSLLGDQAYHAFLSGKVG